MHPKYKLTMILELLEVSSPSPVLGRDDSPTHYTSSPFIKHILISLSLSFEAQIIPTQQSQTEAFLSKPIKTATNVTVTIINMNRAQYPFMTEDSPTLSLTHPAPLSLNLLKLRLLSLREL